MRRLTPSHLSIEEAKASGSLSPSPRAANLHSEFQASRGNLVRPCFKTKSTDGTDVLTGYGKVNHLGLHCKKRN